MLAAKIYRPRQFRKMKNDAIYKEGRALFDETGKAIRGQRQQRAAKKKSQMGRKIETLSWMTHEYETMCLLYDAGADVPEPLDYSDNAILMEYIGSAGSPASTLNKVYLEKEEAGDLFNRLMENVELFLDYERIHADLSAFNILYWEGKVKIIDFPQAINPWMNTNAFFLLARDVERLCQYFGRFGIAANSVELALNLWRQYMGTLDS